MKRYDIINKLIEKNNYKTYLEIGTQKNATYNKISIEKTSVDPDPKAGATHQITSDAFFSKIKSSTKYDIIFVDGDHTHQQAYRDITNSLNHLNENGTIVVHDSNPQSYEAQLVPRVQRYWNGDVWKAIVQLRTERDDLEVNTVNSDEGCCIIKRGKGTLLKDIKLEYKYFDKNRKEWLNLISPEEFLTSLGENVNYKIWEFVPYSLFKDYGKACDECFDLVPNDNDWVIIRDTDCLTLTPSHIHMVKKAIDMHPDTGMFIAVTNRVGQTRQVYDMKLFDDSDIKKHRKIALELASKPLTFTEFDIPISGYFMCMKKSTWKEVGKFRSGILGVDTAISNAIRKAGKKILMINNLYLFHYYRWLEGTKDKSHIK